MKLLLRLFPFMMVFTLAGSEWTDQHLPLADKDKQLYQWTGFKPPCGLWLGGKCDPVRIEDGRSEKEIRAALDIEFEEKMRSLDLKEYKRGGWMVTIGLLIISVAVAAHCMISLPQGKRICEGAGLAGIGVSIAGFLQKKTIEFDAHLIWAIVILISLAIAYKLRNWSISHIFRKKDSSPTKNEENGVMPDNESLDDPSAEPPTQSEENHG
jgi:hypothetical protein